MSTMTQRMITVFLLLSGCAHYTLEEIKQPLTVNTIVTPPHLQIREADLTRLLVGELQSRGYQAAWQPTGENLVACRVIQDRLDELDQGVAAGLRVECDVSRPSGRFQVTSTGLGFTNVGPDSFSNTTDLAAAQAIKDVSFRIDSRLQEGQ